MMGGYDQQGGIEHTHACMHRHHWGMPNQPISKYTNAAVLSSSPLWRKYQGSRYAPLDAEILWHRTSHRYPHSAATPVHIPSSQDPKFCFQRFISVFQADPRGQGPFSLLVLDGVAGVSPASRHGHCLTLCLSSSTLLHSGHLSVWVIPMLSINCPNGSFFHRIRLTISVTFVGRLALSRGFSHPLLDLPTLGGGGGGGVV